MGEFEDQEFPNRNLEFKEALRYLFANAESRIYTDLKSGTEFQAGEINQKGQHILAAGI